MFLGYWLGLDMKTPYIFSMIILSSLFAQVDYVTEIQPIFDNNCTSCHINGGNYYGGLDLSSYASLMEGGNSGNTIVPYDHINSILYQRIILDESDNLSMPQNGSPLSQSNIDLIRQWIIEGAFEVNNNDSVSIIGRWNYVGFEQTVLYQFDSNYRYTIYGTDGDFGGLDEAIPNPNPYSIENDTITIDLFFGNIVNFLLSYSCEGQIVEFINLMDSTINSTLIKEGYDYVEDECEDYDGNLDLEFSYLDNMPTEFKLNQNYPNPFNPITSIHYDLPNDGLVNITIYNMVGEIVKTLVNSLQSAGFNSVQWDATNNFGKPVSAGLYLYSIQFGEHRQTKKMILLK